MEKQNKSTNAQQNVWPRKITFLGLAIFIATAAGISAFLVLKQVNSTVTGPELHLSRPDETIVEPPKPVKTQKEIDTMALENILLSYIASEPTTNFYIYIKKLDSGAEVGTRSDIAVPSGSIYKLFVAHEAYRRNELGEFNFTQKAGSTGYTVGQCVIRMVRNSTNICGEAVRAMLGPERITTDAHAQGYLGVDYTSHEAAHVSPKDIALLYERLLAGATLNDAHRAEFIKSLKDQEWTFRIPEGLPREPVRRGIADWANKTGDVYDYGNDSAIVWGERATYILVVMSNHWQSVFPQASYSIRHFSGLVYNTMNGTNYELVY